jgi:hypothetical protein
MPLECVKPETDRSKLAKRSRERRNGKTVITSELHLITSCLSFGRNNIKIPPIKGINVINVNM